MAVPLVTSIAINARAQISSVKESKTGLWKYLKSTDRELWLTVPQPGGSRSHTIPPGSSDDLWSKTSANHSHTDQEESEGKLA